jgi:hypothetical protein
MDGPGRDDMLMLFSWTRDDAEKAQNKWIKNFGPLTKGSGPLFRWIAVHKLKELHKLFQKKNKNALIEALYICSENSLPLPLWWQDAFFSSYRTIKLYEIKSWDDVFGKPLKCKDIDYNPYQIYSLCKAFKANYPKAAMNRASKNKSVFDEVGKKLGISSSLIEKYYYKIDKLCKNSN